MGIYLSLGILFLALGLIFLIVPFEKLKTVFRRMRHSVSTKIGGAVLAAAGVVTLLMGLFQ